MEKTINKIKISHQVYSGIILFTSPNVYFYFLGIGGIARNIEVNYEKNWVRCDAEISAVNFEYIESIKPLIGFEFIKKERIVEIKGEIEISIIKSHIFN